MSTEDQSRPVQVRCKFRCIAVTKRQNWYSQKDFKFIYDYQFQVVTGGPSEHIENQIFYASTPTGELKIGAVRDDLFEPGKEYYVDITPFIFVPSPPVEAAEEVE